jgi:histone deacetylase complex regulatory component SIN3
MEDRWRRRKTRQPSVDQAINYRKDQDRFRRDERVYKQFLEILNQYRKNQKGIAEVRLPRCLARR